MWIVPSRNRPHLVERIFSKVTPTEKGVIAIDDDQVDLYRHVTLPANWSLDISPKAFFGPKNNAVLARYPNEPWYGSMNDDMLPETEGWDSILPRVAGPDLYITRHRAGGDQEYIEANAKPIDAWQSALPGQFVSYKQHVRKTRVIPDDARVVCLHGKPKFADMPEGDPVKEKWDRAA